MSTSTAEASSKKLNHKLSIMAIGPALSATQKFVNGQAMMFQLLVDTFRERGSTVDVYDTSEKTGKASRVCGSFTWKRVFDYVLILPQIWYKLLFSRPNIIYLSIAQSGVGFLRDLLIVLPASILRLNIVAHQFGGSYEKFYNSRNFLIKWLIRFFFSQIQFLIVEGDLIKDSFSFIYQYKNKVKVIPNGLPERTAESAHQAKSYNRSEALELIYLSNMIESKGYWDVLEAVKILVLDRNRNIRCQFSGKFLIAADASRFSNSVEAINAFTAFIEEHSLQNYITYAEGLYGDEKAKAFNKAHVFLLPSNYILEGQPVSVLEALAYGLVVIATKYRLLPMMVDEDRTGFLVGYNNPTEIADKIELLLDNPDMYNKMSMNSIKMFSSQFSSDKYVNRMESVFYQVTQDV